VVFTGGYSLYEAKKGRHPNVHPFPSSVDRRHFAQARNGDRSPADQASIKTPRFGFYGVIDERMDLEMIAALADAHPEWAIMMVGPVVKIDPADLPQRPNLHYLGGKKYEELPLYLGGWDVALMPFAINESTRFISPTKTPEYLAGGRPVVSTPIADVIRHYSDLEAVFIADGQKAFIDACERALALAQGGDEWLAAVDAKLANLSWDTTYARMAGLMRETIEKTRKGPRLVASAGRTKYDYLVVGAGFAGSVLAERLASQHGARVLVIDKRPHIAGNAYDHLDAAGVLIHQYGPHIFHANSDEIVDYLSQFTRWRPVRAPRARPCARQAGADPDQPDDAERAVRPRSPDRRGGGRLSGVPRRAGRGHPDLGGRRHQRGRARALRAVLPGLYPQAMGPGSEPARQDGDGAHPDPDQHRRPLFRRQAPDHAGGRLHGDVREACSTIPISMCCSAPTTSR
jgi:hypothetical protein